MSILIAGGSGFLGRNLREALEARGYFVHVLSRRSGGDPSSLTWSPDGTPGDLPSKLSGVHTVINLAGEGIADRRWSTARKEAIRQSRVLATRTLVSAMAACKTPPRVFISSSAVGYYGPHGDEPVTESAMPGTDFLAQVCVEWEQEARAAESESTRVVLLRTGLPLGIDGGALAKLLLPFKLGVGGPLGSGQQFMPWIHVDDWCALVVWLIEHEQAIGAFNATAPEPVTNRVFGQTLARVLHRPAVVPTPAFVLQLVLGELATALLTGQRAVPAHAEQLGFRFTYRSLEPALRSLSL